jgi:hypothetical protein
VQRRLARLQKKWGVAGWPIPNARKRRPMQPIVNTEPTVLFTALSVGSVLSIIGETITTTGLS